MPGFGSRLVGLCLLVSAVVLAPRLSGQAPAPRPGQPPPSPPAARRTQAQAQTAGASNSTPAPGTSAASPDAQAPARGTTPELGPWESGPVRGISNAADRPATLRAVNIVREADGPAVEVLTTSPVIPSIQTMDDPLRLVIDLPNTNIGEVEKRTAIQRDQVTNLRIDQFQKEPPVARIVVDLVEAHGFSWDAAGNRLMVRLRPPPSADAAKPAPALSATAASLSAGTRPSVVPVGAGTAGSVMTAGTRVANGSSITTGPDPTVLSIARGGEILVCPRTTLAVTASKSGRELMVSMSTGAMEANYRLDASADSVFTPDFRILLAGPGELHYAVSSNSHGDTCVRTMEGNTTSAIVTELMGDRIYQVKSTGQVLFRNGHIDQPEADVPVDCGCPRPREPVRLASVSPVSDASLASTAPLSTSKVSAPLPPSQPGETHVQVEAPLVFRATDLMPAPLTQAGNQPPGALPPENQPAAPVLPPKSAKPVAPAPVPQTASATPSNGHRGFLEKVKGFFSGVFR